MKLYNLYLYFFLSIPTICFAMQKAQESNPSSPKSALTIAILDYESTSPTESEYLKSLATSPSKLLPITPPSGIKYDKMSAIEANKLLKNNQLSDVSCENQNNGSYNEQPAKLKALRDEWAMAMIKKDEDEHKANEKALKTSSNENPINPKTPLSTIPAKLTLRWW
jgi:hypothetical protein